MDMAFAGIFVIGMLLGGDVGANDLASLMSTSHYWGMRGVVVSTETMTAKLKSPGKAEDISKLIIQMGDNSFQVREQATAKIRAMGSPIIPQLEKAAKSDDPEIVDRATALIEQLVTERSIGAIDRLMAIRTLGESKDKQSLATLKTLTASKAPFEADYARRAMAQIEGKRFIAPAPTEAELENDLWMLPERCAFVGSTRVDGNGSFGFDELFKQLSPRMAEHVKPGVNMGLVDAMNLMGNIRIDSVTFGVSDDIINLQKNGYLVIVLRGLYDPQRVRKAIEQAVRPDNAKVRSVDGVEVVDIERVGRLIFLSSTRLVFTVGGRREAKLMKQLIAASKNGSRPLAGNARLVKLLKTVDRKQGPWAAAVITDRYKKAPYLAPFETVTVVVKRKGNKQSWLITGEGQDAVKIKAVIDEVNAEFAKAKKEMAQGNAAAVLPRPMRDVGEPASILGIGAVAFMSKQLKVVVNSIKIEARGTTATITGEMEGSGPMMRGLILFVVFGYVFTG